MDWILDNHQAIGNQLVKKLRLTSMHRLTIAKVTSGQPVSNQTKQDAEATAKANSIPTTWKQLTPTPSASAGPSPGRRMKDVADDMGLTAMFYGQADNSKRNDAKAALISSSKGTVYLLALTGNSYLSATGIHAPLVETFLTNASNSFVAILRDPFSEAGIKTLLNWIRASRNILKAESDIPQHIVHFTKLRGPLENYIRRLRKTYKERISVRMTRLDTSCTLLCNDSQCFVEPYFEFDEEHRRKVRLDTYELMMLPPTAVGATPSLLEWFTKLLGATRTVLSHLSFFQQHSCDVEAWLDARDRLRRHADLSVEILRDTGMISPQDEPVLRHCLDELSASLKGL